MRLWAYLQGYLVLLVWGNIEKLINLAVERGIRLWEVKRRNGSVSMRVALADVYSLRHVARRARSRFRIMERRGLPFFLGRLRRRWMLVGGGCFFLLSLYILSSFVWQVEVHSQEKLREVDPVQIIGAARENGLYPGVIRRAVDVPDLEAALADRFPRLAWVGVRYQGTRALIEVVERVLPSPEDEAPADLVAAKDGVIREILILAGEARVQEGETVQRGQVLISGRVSPPPPALPGEPAQPAPPSRPVRARGIVRASVWYEAPGTAALVEENQRLTGRRISVLSLLWDEREVIMRGPANPPYRQYRTDRQVEPLPGPGGGLPVRLATTTFYEIEEERVLRALPEARAVAEQRGREILAHMLPPGAHLEGVTVEELTPEKDRVRLRLLAEVLEEIAVSQPLAEEPPSAGRVGLNRRQE